MERPIKNISKSVTFRLSESIVGKLQSFADKKQISLNTLVNQTLTNFIDWDISAVDAGWMVFPKPSLKELINSIKDSELEKIAKNKAQYHNDILLLMSTPDLDGFLTLLRNKTKKSGFPFVETRKNDFIHFIIQHDMGEKWSLFNKIFYEHLISGLDCNASITTTPNTIVLDIKQI